MTDRWQRLEDILHAALERAPDERSGFVRDACGNDDSLRVEAESLLENASAADKSALKMGNLGLHLIGQQIGVYRVDALLGAGGMGEVYRARDTKLQRDVAIKALPMVFTGDGDRRARFEREARVLASLNHSNIGAIYGLEESQGTSYLVLELVEGVTLAELIGKGPISLSESLNVARQIADALDAAHEKGIVHRDLKPANIKLTTDHKVKVLDFGLAKLSQPSDQISTAPTETIATREGAVFGTPGYMSPEQARGEPVDKRADVWAFGCVLYEMLTGHGPFTGRSVADTLSNVIQSEPDWSRVSRAPLGLCRLLRRLLEKDPRRRIRDIGDVRFELDEALNRTNITVEAGPTARLRRGLPVAWALVVMVIAAGAFAIGRSAFSGAASVGVPTFSRVVRLTATAAREMAPAISPDGKWVAYLSDARGPTDVWVQFVAGGGQPINLTEKANIVLSTRSIVGGLEISPDGSRILFQGGPTDTTANATYSVPAPLGGVPSVFLERGRFGLRWSPDGQRIAYVMAGGSTGDAIWIADRDGSNERVLVQVEGNLHKHWPSWSADGKYIYFNQSMDAWNAAPTQVYRVAATGGPPEPFVSSASRAAFPAPTPDGRGLIYAADPAGAELNLWWRPLDGGGSARLTTGVGEYAQPRISLNGETMVCTLLERRDSLVRVDLGSGPGLSAVAASITDGYTGDLDPHLSRDGDRLVFSSTRSGQRNLWIARGDATDPQPLTSGAAIDEYPQFSPDGQQVAFISNRGGERGLWIVSRDGGIPSRLLAAPVHPYFSWSPDGREIVYSTPVGELPGLSIVNVGDRRARRLPTQNGATSPAWSPTADLISYLDVLPNKPGQPGRAFVRFMTSSGQPVPLDIGQTVPFNNGFLAWSRDGRKLAVTRVPPTAAATVWVSDLDASRPFHQVFKLPDDALVRGMAWSGDGRSVIIGQQRASSDIVLFDQAPGSP